MTSSSALGELSPPAILASSLSNGSKGRRTLNLKPREAKESTESKCGKLIDSLADRLNILQQIDKTTTSAPPAGIEEQETQNTIKDLEYLARGLIRKTSSLPEDITTHLESSSSLEAECQTQRTLGVIANCSSPTSHLLQISRCKARLLRKLIEASIHQNLKAETCRLFERLCEIPGIHLSDHEKKTYTALLIQASLRVRPILHEYDLLHEGSFTLHTSSLPFPAPHQIISGRCPDLIDLMPTLDAQQTHAADILHRCSLHLAAASGDVKVVKNVLRSQDNVNERDVFKCTPLFYAALNGNKDVLEELCKAGANIGDQNRSGQSVLCAAASAGHIDAVHLLLQKGADPNGSCLGLASPLYSAAENGHFEVCRTLLHKGARADDPLSHGKTAIDVALTKGHLDVAALCRGRHTGTVDAAVPWLQAMPMSSCIPETENCGTCAPSYGHKGDNYACDTGTSEMGVNTGRDVYGYVQAPGFLEAL